MAVVNNKIKIKKFKEGKKRKPQSDKPNFTKGLLGKTEYNKIGHYKESTGGGTPLPKGHKLKDHPEAERVQQPRDEEGRFTYNSMNRRTRKFKYHAKKKVIINGKEKWRLKTKDEMSVPPPLRDKKFAGGVKSKDRIVFEKDIYVLGQDISKEELLDMFREYHNVDGRVNKKGQGISDRGFGEKADTTLNRKKGRTSKAEKQVTKYTKESLIETTVREATKANRKKYRHKYWVKNRK